MKFAESFIKIAFPKFYNTYMFYYNSYHTQTDNLNKVKSDLRKESQFKDNIRRVLINDNLILGLEQKSYDEHVIVCKKSVGPSIKILDADNPSVTHVEILASYNNNNNYESKKSIHIHEVLCNSMTNQGYGTIAMKYLIEMAAKENIQEITGDISRIDKEDMSRVEHFYKKFGFKFEDNFIKRAI